MVIGLFEKFFLCLKVNEFLVPVDSKPLLHKLLHEFVVGDVFLEVVGVHLAHDVLYSIVFFLAD